MSGVGNILESAKKSLMAQQTALQVASNNIANANTEEYSRQEVIMEPDISISSFTGYEGTGVRIARIRQVRDTVIEQRLNKEKGQSERWIIERQTYANLEGIFNEPSDYSLQAQLSVFWNSWEALSQDPSNEPLRANLIGESQTLAEKFSGLRSNLDDFKTETENSIHDTVSNINSKLAQLAEINQKLGVEEDNNLKDTQYKLVSELSQLISITTTSDSKGRLHVNSNGQKLVQLGLYSEIQTVEEHTNDGDKIQIVIKGLNSSINLAGGKLAGLLNSYNTIVPGYTKRIDDMANGLIIEINKLHSQGYGLSGFTELEGSYSFKKPYLDMEEHFNELNLPGSINRGSFKIRIEDANGDYTDTVINVLDDENRTLEDIIDAISEVDGIDASIGLNNRVKLVATSGKKFHIAEDSSGLLASLGLNNFFEGTSSLDMAVAEHLATDYSKIAASSNGEAGNNGNVLNVLSLRQAGIFQSGTITIEEHYQTTITTLGVESVRMQNFVEDQTAIVSQLQDQRDSASGVSIDEEMANIIKFQRAYQASARMISVVDEMMDIIVNQLKR